MSGIRHNIAFKNFRSWKYWTICARALDTHTHTSHTEETESSVHKQEQQLPL